MMRSSFDAKLIAPSLEACKICSDKLSSYCLLLLLSWWTCSMALVAANNLATEKEE